MSRNTSNFNNNHSTAYKTEGTIEEDIVFLSKALQDLNLKKAKSRKILKEEKQLLRQLEEDITKKERALEDSERLIDTYELKLRRALEAKHSIDGAKSVRQEKEEYLATVKNSHSIKTPYKITSFSGKGKSDLYIGDRVHTNDGKGEFKGKFQAIVLSLARQPNRVKLRFDGIRTIITRDIKFLQHADQVE